MAFPIVQGRNASAATANATTQTADQPASITKDEMLIVQFVRKGTTAWFPAATDSTTKPLAGYAVLADLSDTGTGAIRGLWLYKQQAQGTESGSLSIPSAVSANWVARTWRISGHDPNTPPAFASASDGGTGSANPDPPSLNPADWGTEDTLWLACGVGDGNVAFTGAPSSYTDSDFQLSTDGTTSNRVAGGAAERQLNAASEDPGAFTRASEDWIAATIGIRPAPTPHAIPILRCQSFVTSGALATTHDFTVTVDAGSNRRFIVAVGAERSGGVTVTAVTLDPAGANISLSKVTDGTTTAEQANNPGGTDTYAVVWELRDSQLPAPGSYTLRILTGATSTELAASVTMVSNADQSTNVSAVAKTTTSGATSLSVSPTVANQNSLVLAIGHKNQNEPFTASTIAGFQGVVRADEMNQFGEAWIRTFTKGLTTETGSQTVQVTMTSVRTTLIAIVLAPLSTPATAKPRRALLGVGF